MKSFVVCLALAALQSFVAAQSIDPSTIPQSDKDQWCQSQKTSCPILCSQVSKSDETEKNSCDSTTLAYACVCSNGKSPNASEYSQTIPYFECTEFNNNCVKNCGTDSSCASDCRQNHPCGAQNPKRVNLTTASATHSKASQTAQSTSNPNGFSDFGGDSNGASALALMSGQAYGLALLLTGLLVGSSLL